MPAMSHFTHVGHT